MIESKLNIADLLHKKVFLRADLDVPMKEEYILDDFKLQSLIPTLELLIAKSAYIILATHLKCPEITDNKNLNDKYITKYSTKAIANWYDNKGYTVYFAKNLNQAVELSNKMEPGSILFLENLRLFPGEENYNKDFAEKLYKLAPDYYVNESFGLIDKDNTSISLLPKLYSLNNKSIGLLMEKELVELSKLKETPRPPVVLIMGGSNISIKLPLIERMLDKVNTILLLPPLVFTFMKAKGEEIGKSLIDLKQLDKAKEILNKAKEHNIEIIFPKDYLIAEDTINGRLIYKSKIEKNDFGIAIGPETLKKYIEHIVVNSNANTILFNGTMGFLDRPQTTRELKTLLQTVAQSNAYTVIGGGDSVAAVNLFNLNSGLNFLSTGGGASLAFLSNKPLIGLINTIN